MVQYNILGKKVISVTYERFCTKNKHHEKLLQLLSIKSIRNTMNKLIKDSLSRRCFQCVIWLLFCYEMVHLIGWYVGKIIQKFTFSAVFASMMNHRLNYLPFHWVRNSNSTPCNDSRWTFPMWLQRYNKKNRKKNMI